MKGKRKQHTAAFKAQVALAALKGDKTINEVAAHFGVHPTNVHAWRKHLLAGAEAVFTNGGPAASADHEAADRPAPDGADLGEKKSCRPRLTHCDGWSSRTTLT